MELKVTISLTDDQLKTIANYISESGLITSNQDKPLNEQYITVNQFAAYMQISTQTVLNHIKDGLIEATKPGKSWRISRQALKDYANG